MDARAFREELCNHAPAHRQAGYFCLLPDMYYRLGTCRFDLPRRNDPMSAVIRAHMNHITSAMYRRHGRHARLARCAGQGQEERSVASAHCMSGR